MACRKDLEFKSIFVAIVLFYFILFFMLIVILFGEVRYQKRGYPKTLQQLSQDEFPVHFLFLTKLAGGEAGATRDRRTDQVGGTLSLPQQYVIWTCNSASPP